MIEGWLGEEEEEVPSKILRRLIPGRGIFQDKDDRVAAEKHFRNESVFVDCLRLLFSFARLWVLGPHLLDVGEDHVAVPVEGFDPTQESPVVAAVDEDLCVFFDRLSQNRQGSRLELVLAPFATPAVSVRT